MVILPNRVTPQDRVENLTDRIYTRLKQDIFDFRLMPGARFTESEVASRMSASRTPVREALTRLQHDGYVEVHFRSGWQVRPFDFRQFEQLYDVRIILELAAVSKLCDLPEQPPLEDLKRLWLILPIDRLQDPATVSALDERFHEHLVEATGNHEMARIHHELTERIRIVRRLDFTKPDRIQATYGEHAEILQAILLRQTSTASSLLRTHIEVSKAEIKKITLHMLQEARPCPAGSDDGISRS